MGLLKKEHSDYYPAAYETNVHARYRALQRAGIRICVWAEDGVYYAANDHLHPDYTDKRRITLDEFNLLLMEYEHTP